MNEEYFYKLNTISKCSNRLLDKARDADSKNDWFVRGHDMLKLSIDDLSDDPEIMKMCILFKCRANILRLFPGTSYSWHKDHPGREAGINMLLDGWDSITMTGNPMQFPRIFKDLTKVPYEKDRYILINVHKWHAVYNFSGMRYLLSIGVPIEGANYLAMLDYIKQSKL